MTKKKLKYIFVIIVAILIYHVNINFYYYTKIYKKYYQKHFIGEYNVLSDFSEPNIERKNTSNVKATSVTTSLEEKIVKGKNLIYCSTFQMSWNELCKKLNKPSLNLESLPEYVDTLNRFTNETFIKSKESYIVVSGFGRENIIQKINNELRRFSNPPLINFDVKPEELVSFSYLFKQLIFKDEFEKIDDFKFTSSNNLPTPVYGFGIKEYKELDHRLAALANQTKILAHAGDYSIIKLETLSDNESMILSSFPIKETLLKTYTEIISVCENEKYEYEGKPLFLSEPMSNSSELKIPKINFKLTHEFTEIIGKRIINSDRDFISKAIQSIDFKLNEKGATLDSYAVVDKLKGIGGTNYHFNKPFILFLKENDSNYPYFMIYIDNDELLVKR